MCYTIHSNKVMLHDPIQTKVDYPDSVILPSLCFFQDFILQEPSSISIFCFVVLSHLKLLHTNEALILYLNSYQGQYKLYYIYSHEFFRTYHVNPW